MTREIQGWVELPSLQFRLRVRVRRIPASVAPFVESRWDFQDGDVRDADAEIDVEATDEPVGFTTGRITTAEVRWADERHGTLDASAASVELTWDGPLRGVGAIRAENARGALESLFRAAAVLCLAKRGVVVVHASSVHREGSAVLFLGDSSAGKTTTARRLGREDFVRIADDMLAVDVSGPVPLLHGLPFERSGRWLPAVRSLTRAPVARGALVVAKGASAPQVDLHDDALGAWSRARIGLAMPPGSEEALLDQFEKLARIPLATLAAPPSGSLGPVVTDWLASLERIDNPRNQAHARRFERGGPPPARSADASRRAPQATPQMSEDNQDSALSKRVARSPNVAWRLLEGSVVFVAPSSPLIHTLNPVGTLVWQLADGRSVGEIIEAVVNEFEVARTEATVDVDRFVTDLVGRGFMTATPGAPG